MTLLDLNCSTLILHEPGILDQIGAYASSWSCCRALIVSDPGIVATGHPQRAIQYLQQAGIQTQLFTDVHENPSTDDVQRGVEIANEFQPDLLIGLGGGSSMDCAKGINFLYCGGGQMQDYWGIGKATEPMLPMIAIPTTAGTGSETQSFALISDAKTHAKMACGDKKATCKLAILDPELTLTQPAHVTALTGIDALAHALETYVTTTRTDLSMDYSRRAWELLSVNFINVIDTANNLEARSAMQLGACLAGLAIENSMLGAAHALANPLTSHFNIVHGQAVASMLPHVIRFNAQSMESQYCELAVATNAVSGDDSEALATFITEITQHSGLATRLEPQGVNADQLPMLAADAAKQWTARFNPRTVEVEDLLALYQQAF
ncbi:MAG: iron-containing alcohol dehydrogenase [Planctomycetaceae bacterium]|nr:iron-containing alcohol dehydrogenase [Planctomycetaceae bacterium]MBT5125138.1 iron-containing alcohol dehydrogenase [Planctomycetaceae bacterium]